MACLVDRYAPRHSNDIVGNSEAVNALLAWLTDRRRKVPGKRCVMLSGPGGCGTTTAARLCLQEAGFDVVDSNASALRTGSEMRAQLEGLGSVSRTIFSRRPKALLLDEVDALMKGDTGGADEVIAFMTDDDPPVTSRRRVPVVATCRQTTYGKIAELTKKSDVIAFERVRDEDLRRFVRMIEAEQGLSLGDATGQLVTAANGDVRQLLTSLQLWGERVANSQRDEHVDVNRAIERLMRGDGAADMHGGLLLFDTDSAILPLMMHENYLDVMRDDGASVESAARASELMSCGDVVDEYIYGHQAWQLNAFYGVCSVVGPSQVCWGVRQTRPEHTAKRRKREELRFGTLWSKTSNTFARKKRLRHLCASMAAAHATVTGMAGPWDMPTLDLMRDRVYDMICRRDWQGLWSFCRQNGLFSPGSGTCRQQYADMYTLLKFSSLSSTKTAYKSSHHAKTIDALSKLEGVHPARKMLPHTQYNPWAADAGAGW